MPKNADKPKISFFQPNDRLFSDWRDRLYQGQQGARLVDIDYPALSLARAPPKARFPPPAAVPPTSPKPDPRTGSAVADIIIGIRTFKAWLNEPEPTPAKPASKSKETNTPKVPPFDIQDIPKAMERNSWFVSAKLMRHWFAGRANASLTKKDEKKQY